MSAVNDKEYCATDEYNKHLRLTHIPGNMPARVMRKAMAKLADPHYREELAKMTGSSVIQKWAAYEKMKKIEVIAELTSLDDIRELIYLDDDEDVQEALIARKRELNR